MAKAYWITCYRSISDPEALSAYAKLAGPAIQAVRPRVAHHHVRQTRLLLEAEDLVRLGLAHVGIHQQRPLAGLGQRDGEVARHHALPLARAGAGDDK